MSRTSPSPYGALRALGPSGLAAALASLAFVGAFFFSVGVEAAAIGADPALAPPLSVLISRSGFTLLGADDSLPDPAYATIPCRERRCSSVDAYDYDGLSARLALVKDRWPQRESLRVQPTDAVPMEVVLRAVGAITADRRAALNPDDGRILFPDVLVVRRIFTEWREIPSRP